MNNTGELMESSEEVQSQAIGSLANVYQEADTITTKRDKNRVQNVHNAQKNDNKKGYNNNVRLQQWQVPHDETIVITHVKDEETIRNKGGNKVTTANQQVQHSSMSLLLVGSLGQCI